MWFEMPRLNHQGISLLQICALYIFGNKATDGTYGSKYWFPGFCGLIQCQIYNDPVTWVVVSNIFVHPYLGNDLSWRAYFSDRLKPPTSYFSWLEDVQRIWFIYYQSVLTSMTSWYSIIGACFGLCRMLINCNKSHFQLARFLVQNRLTLQDRSKIDLDCV